MTAVAVTARLPVGILSTGSELAARRRSARTGEKIYGQQCRDAGGPDHPGGRLSPAGSGHGRRSRAARRGNCGAVGALPAGGDNRRCLGGRARLSARGGTHSPCGNPLPWTADEAGQSGDGLRVGGGLLLALSGNPFAAAAGFELMGDAAPPPSDGAADDFGPPGAGQAGGRLFQGESGPALCPCPFHRGNLPSARGAFSGMLASMVGCNCLVDIPAGRSGAHAGQSGGGGDDRMSEVSKLTHLDVRGHARMVEGPKRRSPNGRPPPRAGSRWGRR